MKKTAAISLITVVVLIAGCQSSTKPGCDGVPTVRIGYLNLVTSLPLSVAGQKGFFTDQGVVYKAIPVASSNKIVEGVVNGDLDCFVGASAVPALAAELRAPGKLKVFAVSEITADQPFDALLVRKDSPIRALSDLSGKKVAVFPGTTATNLLRKYLGDKGVNVSTITFVPMAPANHLDALMESSVDVVYAYEPTIAIALSKGAVKKLRGSVYADMLSPNPISVSMVSTGFLQRHPQTAAKVIAALERAMEYVREQDEQARCILVEQMKLSEDAADRCVFLYMLGHEQIDLAVFQRFADMLTELGELNGHVAVDSLVYR
ncbi:MAG: ABC transporter substrate-binding protein [Planctomycetota bacterium]|nr:MAG: ABC transporter substrate-binding protein [Planctomycetota bacterium]